MAPRPRRLGDETRIVLTVVLGEMLVPLNSTMIAVALPRVIDDFDARLSSAAWLQMAALEAVDASMGGFASGMFSTSRYLGSIAGISLLAGPLAPAATGFGGFRTLFAAVTAAAAASAVAAFLLPGAQTRGRPRSLPRP